MKHILSPEKEIHLKKGFLFFISTTVILFTQFFAYLYNSYLTTSIDWIGWLYYTLSASGHAFLFTLIPFFTLYLPSVLFTRFYKTALTVLFSFYLLLNLLAYLNGIIFRLYKFHINGFVTDMVFGANAGQIFVFNPALVYKSIGVVLAFFIIGLILLWISKTYYRKIHLKNAIFICIFFISGIVTSHIGHAYAAVAGKSSIENAALSLPQFYPLTANRLLLKLGVVKKEDLYTDNSEKNKHNVVNYPLHPLETDDHISRKNIIFLLVDSWNPRTLTPETCPNMYRFSRKSENYLRHLSSSNGTRGGIFGWFFGISPIYWKYFEIAGIQPVFIERLLQLDYDIRILASASLVNPPFYRVVFGNVKNLRTETPGSTPFERDNRITKDFLAYLDQREQDTIAHSPFFAFLFYDLPHAIDLPQGYPRRFQPAWEYADYMQLGNETDPTPFFNLYRNCTWHTDSLIGCILQKLETRGLLENSVVIISGDHSQEFNENKKNFWGHNGNFSDAQIHVPLLYYYPGVTPGQITHQTTHYDIIPTLMHTWLGVNNPYSDYSMGQLLSDSLRPPFHITGSFDNHAVITDSVIYEKKTAGRLIITDRQLNKYEGLSDARVLQEAIRFKNRFLKDK